MFEAGVGIFIVFATILVFTLGVQLILSGLGFKTENFAPWIKERFQTKRELLKCANCDNNISYAPRDFIAKSFYAVCYDCVGPSWFGKGEEKK